MEVEEELFLEVGVVLSLVVGVVLVLVVVVAQSQEEEAAYSMAQFQVGAEVYLLVQLEEEFLMEGEEEYSKT